MAAILAAGLLLGLAPAPPDRLLRFDSSGRLLLPADYREWVFLSAGLNMSYNADPAMAGADMFGNTFVQAFAYRAFLRTGTWPEGTAIVLENRGGSSHGSINRHGMFQNTNYMGAEIHVKECRKVQRRVGVFQLPAGRDGGRGNTAREKLLFVPPATCRRRHNVRPILPHAIANRDKAGNPKQGLPGR